MEEEVCEFYFIDADFLRSRQDTKPLPNFQKLQVESPAAFKRERYSMTQVVTGFHTKEDLIISHRWFQSECPDPDGMQLAAIKNFLKEHKYIERVWFDEWCMPQGNRTDVEQTSFDLMLSNVNMLYLGASVLIHLDLSYQARFWTQFEAWCSMQLPTPQGLKPSRNTTQERFHIRCIQGAAEQSDHHKQFLITDKVGTNASGSQFNQTRDNKTLVEEI